MFKVYLSRSQTRRMSADHPIGDPTAFGQTNDPVTAIVGAAGAGLIGNIVGGVTQSDAQRQAAHTQADMFNRIVQQEQPFLQAGYGATNTLQQALGLAPGNAGGLGQGYLTQTFNPTQQQLEAYPGYQFNLTQGSRAIQNQMTPGSGALSGATLKSLMNFNQGLADTYYNNYFNQFQQQQNNIFNRLSNLAGLGQSAAGNLGNSGTQLGTGIASAQANAGGSLGAAISGGLNTAGQGALLSSILSGANPAGGGGSSSVFPSGSLNYGLPTSGFAAYGGAG